MKFVVYCLEDKQVLEVDADCITLGDLENLQLRDWVKQEYCEAKILYDDVVYSCAVLQVGYFNNCERRLV